MTCSHYAIRPASRPAHVCLHNCFSAFHQCSVRAIHTSVQRRLAERTWLGLSLAQTIAQLEDTAPTDLDPEDIYGGYGKDATDADNDRNVNVGPSHAGREHYVDTGPSELRKMRDSIADPKYDGIKTTRNHWFADEFNEKDAEDDASATDHKAPIHSHMNDAPSSPSDAREDHEDQEAHLPLQSSITISEVCRQPSPHSKHAGDNVASQQDEALASSLQRSRAADKLKGKAVVRQLALWDSLVDARIRLQKSVTAANRLPHPDNIAPYVSSPAGRAAAQIFLSDALQLSEELFELRHMLLAQRDSSLPPRKKRRIDANPDELDYEALVKESTSEMMALDAATHPETLSTLQKWSSKVQAVAPSALLPSSRVSFKNGPAYVKGAAELVEEALREPGKAVKRTWGKADKVTRIGGSNPKAIEDEGDEDIFDDRDFYHAMLRDVIESKGGRDGINAADLYANSKNRKEKKVVDTKASKGRKLRYEPHQKLQNFMVPVPVRGAWHEEQIDELFASLLGRGFEGHKGRDGAEVAEASETVGRDRDVLPGFRVFG